MGSFVLHGNIIDSESPERLRVAADSYLVCEEGRCTGVFSALPERFSGLPLTDFGDRLILPGMTDLHLHAPQFAFRGLGMDLELLDWLNARTFPEEAKYADLGYAALPMASSWTACAAAPRRAPSCSARCTPPPRPF